SSPPSSPSCRNVSTLPSDSWPSPGIARRSGRGRSASNRDTAPVCVAVLAVLLGRVSLVVRARVRHRAPGPEARGERRFTGRGLVPRDRLRDGARLFRGVSARLGGGA